ncbi:MAG: 4Fe-4S dicluster domain-containing protein, partial [Candidatus Methanomethylophilaceae archaeon]|nr:4Fe-4S dicluster domain-containing protein [Candidatus Methanomethylophilaceae archaeon]
MEHRADIVELMNGCVGCGECNVVCPSYNKGGCDPMTVMKGDESKVSGCIGCGECSKICGYTDPWKVMMYMNCVVNGMEI